MRKRRERIGTHTASLDFVPPTGVAGVKSLGDFAGSLLMKTHYDILGVAPDADYETIKAAYRRAVKAHHPDLHVGSASAELHSKRIITAHSVLKDAERRSRYDDFLHRQQKRIRLSLVIGLVSAAVMASGTLIMLSVVLRPDAKLPALSAVASTKADRVTTADGAPPEPAMKGAPLSGGPLAAPPAESGAPKAEAAPTEPKEHDRIAAPAQPLPFSPAQTALREETATFAGAEPSLTFLSEQPQLLPAPLGIADAAPKPTAVTAENPPASVIAGPPPQDMASDHPSAPEAGGDLVTNALPASIAQTQSADASLPADAQRPVQVAVYVPAGAAAADYTNAQHHMRRAEDFAAQGDLEKALTQYDAAVSLDETSIAAFHGRGMIWRRRGDVDRALVDLDRAIRLSFSDPEIYRDRGAIWFDRGNYERAIADFNQAIKLKPDFADAYFRRGVAQRQKGAFENAVEDLDRAMRLDPSLQGAQRNRDLARMEKSAPVAEAPAGSQ